MLIATAAKASLLLFATIGYFSVVDTLDCNICGPGNRISSPEKSLILTDEEGDTYRYNCQELQNRVNSGGGDDALDMILGWDNACDFLFLETLRSPCNCVTPDGTLLQELYEPTAAPTGVGGPPPNTIFVIEQKGYMRCPREGPTCRFNRSAFDDLTILSDESTLSTKEESDGVQWTEWRSGGRWDGLILSGCNATNATESSSCLVDCSFECECNLRWGILEPCAMVDNSFGMPTSTPSLPTVTPTIGSIMPTTLPSNAERQTRMPTSAPSISTAEPTIGSVMPTSSAERQIMTSTVTVVSLVALLAAGHL